ncbi:MAG TPA: phosphoribosylformylglycinamidine synthase subunit PurS [Thermomicrobiales bacterium]|jgi:phosphoribosylformylglycinamidine synthase
MTSQSQNGLDGTDRQWTVEVVVVPKEGVNDPEGEAILGGLRSLGYSAVTRAQAGRFFTLTLSARDEEAARADAARMADRLLANPVIQTFRIGSVLPVPSTARRT